MKQWPTSDLIKEFRLSSLEYQADPSHVFKSDYNQMKIILINLMSNAVKYHNLNQPNPYIRVHLKE